MRIKNGQSDYGSDTWREESTLIKPSLPKFEISRSKRSLLDNPWRISRYSRRLSTLNDDPRSASTILPRKYRSVSSNLSLFSGVLTFAL